MNDPAKSNLTPLRQRFIDPNAPLAKQQEMLLALMRDPPENSRIITITPALAEWILNTFNTAGVNRKPKPARIQRYREAMEHSAWLLTGEPIIFGKEQLLDGQNRLMGCVRSGKPFRTHVVFGISDNVFAVINSGKSRDITDTFFTYGVKDYKIVSHAIRWLMIYADGKPMARTSYSNQQMWDHYNNPEKVDQDLMLEAIARSKMVSKVIPRPAMCAHFYLFAKKNERVAQKMATDFDKNQFGARRLTTHISNTKKQRQGRLNDVWINAMIVATWNAYRANRTVTKKDLTWDMGVQEYPVIA